MTDDDYDDFDIDLENRLKNFRCDVCGAYVHLSPVFTCHCHGWDLCEYCESEHNREENRRGAELMGLKEIET